MRNLTWFEPGEVIDEQDIVFAQNRLGVLFPPDYLSVASVHDGASNPDECEFEYIDRGRKRIGNFGTLLSLRDGYPDGVFDAIENLGDQLPKSVIPIIDTGSGDCICFDYRDSSIPSIVYFSHELAGDEATIFVAKSFAEFLDGLKEPEDE